MQRRRQFAELLTPGFCAESRRTQSTVGLLEFIPKNNAEKMGDLVPVVRAADPRTIGETIPTFQK
jgi:hypothetical protein